MTAPAIGRRSETTTAPGAASLFVAGRQPVIARPSVTGPSATYMCRTFSFGHLDSRAVMTATFVTARVLVRADQRPEVLRSNPTTDTHAVNGTGQRRTSSSDGEA